MRKLVLPLVLALAGFSTAAFASSSQTVGSPAPRCQAEQADSTFTAAHGGKTFDQFYGSIAHTALDNCTAAKGAADTTTSTTTTTPSTPNVSALCRTERATDAAGFKKKYGTNRNKSNAFGKCVSAKAKAQSITSSH